MTKKTIYYDLPKNLEFVSFYHDRSIIEKEESQEHIYCEDDIVSFILADDKGAIEIWQANLFLLSKTNVQEGIIIQKIGIVCPLPGLQIPHEVVRFTHYDKEGKKVCFL
jgi:hypothetical protein